jgi:hypothetical protein
MLLLLGISQECVGGVHLCPGNKQTIHVDAIASTEHKKVHNCSSFAVFSLKNLGFSPYFEQNKN